MVPYLFRLAAVCPGRQQGFRHAVVAHLVLLAAGVAWAYRYPQQGTSAIGYFLLTAGIVEGALLLGWRLTQLPKSQALEFLLVSPLRPALVFLAEALVGLTRLALVTLAGLPLLILLYADGSLLAEDLVVLLALPFIW